MMVYKQYRRKPSAAASTVYLVGAGDLVLPGVKDDEFVGLRISIHDRLQVLLIFLAAFIIGTHKRLAATGNRCLTFWMNP